MALTVGSLMAGMQNLGKGTVIAVLIIDQPEPKLPVADLAVPNLTRQQQTLLAFAGNLGCLFWRIELSQQGIVGQYPTATRLKGFLPPNAPVVTKQRLNAFEGTTLANQLNAAHVTHVVLLGHETNCCVKFTAIGGKYRKTDAFVEGATGNHFKVLTSRQVLSGGDPNWINEADVTFYTTL